jgi:rhamnogalacturonyl hydrolase YesR
MNIRKTLQEGWLVVNDRLGVQFSQPGSNRAHLAAAMNWLKVAQDMTSDAGVAQTYLIRHGKWANSYPETTGYIIPTFYRYYSMFNDEEYRERAIAMADWECEIQLESGGVLAGALGDSKEPTIFNTGQVLFGWATAFEQEGSERYRTAAARAATWLCDVMDDDGCWRQFGSPFTTRSVNLYNTRSAWGLCRVHEITGERRFRDAAIANAEWALGHCHENGWADHNCLLDDSQPFLHTIAYAMRGFLEIGIYCNREDFIEQARKMGDAVINCIRSDGKLPGRYDNTWRPTVSWSCLTGNAQIAINWGRLYQRTREEKYRAAMLPVVEFTKRTQKLAAAGAESGGIKGSHPVNGGYHPWQYPNWAAKFFADALMMAETLTEDKGPYQDWPR